MRHRENLVRAPAGGEGFISRSFTSLGPGSGHSGVRIRPACGRAPVAQTGLAFETGANPLRFGGAQNHGSFLWGLLPAFCAFPSRSAGFPLG